MSGSRQPRTGVLLHASRLAETNQRVESNLCCAGFYSYDKDSKRAGLWEGLREQWGGQNMDIPLEDLKEQMLFAESLETVRCLDEGVIEAVADANIGSVMGIGFPAWTGGVIQYMNGYEGGLSGFVARARELSERYGERFRPADSLVAKAEAGERFGDYG